jgi:glycosyltransferase involved in cell wall biosynthesis
MVMKKLLFIAPHLSTGGLPQYLTKKIELLKDDFLIYLVEWVDHTGGRLVVQRNKILSLIDSDKFFTLEDNKQELLSIINKIQPDIIHLEEIPEFFMDFDIAKQIYTQDRKYIIVETSHDSSYNTDQKSFFPDKFMFVSDWQIQQYKNIDIPKVLVEYPIDYKERPNREEALQKLGLDPNKKHILHIGLFTPRKNQKEFFEFAKALPEFEFHCVGNQADNFRHYWEPLMLDKPSNLTWWDERSDVDSFYSSMDLFLFTSRGTNQDKETMPLVIREAISWKIPLLIYNLPVYLNYFDKFDNIKYLDFNNFKENCNKISKTFYNKEYLNKEEEAVIISTYPNTQRVIDVTLQNIESAKKTGRKVILTSHIPVPKELEKAADYVIVDNNNLLTKHTYYAYSYYTSYEYYTHINLKAHGNDIYHGPACYTNYYNGTCLAKGLGFKKVFFLNYDYEVKEEQFLNYVSLKLNDKSYYVHLREGDQEGPTVTTWFLATRPEDYLNDFPPMLKEQDYTDAMHRWGSETNGLENMVYHNLKFVSNKVYYEKNEDFNKLADVYLKHYDFSRVEYFTILPISRTNNKFIIWFSINNATDSRVMDLLVSVKEENNWNLVKEYNIKIDGNTRWFDSFDFNNKDYKIIGYFYDKEDILKENLLETKEIILDSDYFNNKLKDNGYIEFK